MQTDFIDSLTHIAAPSQYLLRPSGKDNVVQFHRDMQQVTIEIPLIAEKVAQHDIIFLNQLKISLLNGLSRRGFGVAQLAISLATSPALLKKRISKLTGLSPCKLLLMCRMNFARNLLQTKNCSLRDVAANCGFGEQANFCRSFYHTYKCTPSAYRQSIISDSPVATTRWSLPLTVDHLSTIQMQCTREPLLAEVLMNAIDNVHNESFTVDMLARNVYISSASLFRKIKDTLDITPQRLIRDIRLQHAMGLMMCGRSSVSHVAHHAGFFDHAHFCRCFKSVFGCTPSAYRGDMASVVPLSQLRMRLADQNDKKLNDLYKKSAIYRNNFVT